MSVTIDAGLAFGVALSTAPIVLWILRRFEILDVPNIRSSHLAATPRSGGIAPALACVVAAATSAQLSGSSRSATLVITICLGFIGLADDVRSRRVLPRLAGQTAVVLIALIWLLHGISGDWLFRAIVAGAMVVWVVGYANVFNFMDGINGLAVAQIAIAGITWWIIGSYRHVVILSAAGLIASAAALAFAPFNFPRARMFLGDVGSYFFGGWLSVAAIVGLRSGIAPEAVLAPLTIFLGDAGLTLALRLFRHQPWSQPHKEHAYQRLVQAGWSHGCTTVTISLVMISISALGALSLTGRAQLRILGDLLGLLVLGGYLAGSAFVSKNASPSNELDPPPPATP